MRLIDDDIGQDDAEASHADAAQVIILSSDSEHLPSLKIRRANQKDQPSKRIKLRRRLPIGKEPLHPLIRPLMMMWIIRTLR